MSGEGAIERDSSLCVHYRCGAVVHGGRGHQADAAVTVFVVVSTEEPLAVSASILDRTKPIGEVGPVLQGFEL